MVAFQSAVTLKTSSLIFYNNENYKNSTTFRDASEKPCKSHNFAETARGSLRKHLDLLA